MKKIIITFACGLLLITCKENNNTSVNGTNEKIVYTSYGKKITKENVISRELAAKKFMYLSEGDTINLKFTSTVNEVCKSKGCWMKLDLGKGKESMVRFKDYSFFVPLDADNKEAIVLLILLPKDECITIVFSCFNDSITMVLSLGIIPSMLYLSSLNFPTRFAVS